MGSAELLKRLQEPAVELRRPAPTRLPVGRLRLTLFILAIFPHVFGVFVHLFVAVLLRRISGHFIAAVPDNRRTRRGRGRRGRHLGALLLHEWLKRVSGLPGVQSHRLAQQLLVD